MYIIRIIQYQDGNTILIESVNRSIEGEEGREEDVGLYFEYLSLLISKGADVNCTNEVSYNSIFDVLPLI